MTRRVLAWSRGLLADGGGLFVLLEPALRETSRSSACAIVCSPPA